MTLKRTTDHQEIQRWVQDHDGRPAALKIDSGKFAIVRIEFHQSEAESASNAHLQPISWDEFFQEFDQQKLAFIYDEEVPRGQESTRSKLVRRQGS